MSKPNQGPVVHQVQQQALVVAVIEQVGGDGVGGHQRQRGQRRGADGEPLARGGGGVAQGVQRIRPLPNLRRQVGLFCDAAGVVGHRPVGVRGQGNAKGGKHAHAGKGNAVEAVKLKGHNHGAAHRQNRYQRAHHSRGQPVNHHRGVARSGSFPPLLWWADSRRMCRTQSQSR